MMFKYVFFLLVMTASSAQAFFVTITECQASSKTHTLKMHQEQDDVLVSLDNLKENSWGRIESDRKIKYKVSGRTVSTARVHNVSLAELRTFKESANLVASLMFSRSEFDGDYDMVHSYAHNLVYNMACK